MVIGALRGSDRVVAGYRACMHLRGYACFDGFFGCFLNYLAFGDFLEVFYGEVYVKDSVKLL